MIDCQYVVRPAGQPARTYQTVEATARALLDAGSAEPVTVVTHGSSGQHERALSATELRRLGEAIRDARENPPAATTGGLARLAKALNGVADYDEAA